VFLGSTTQQSSKKGGETKPLLIPDFVHNGAYDESFEEEQEIVGSLGARIVLRAPKAKPKLENVSLTMWVAANARIMHELSQTGKLASMGQIADYLSYTVKVAELLESHILNSVILYDNEYRKLQHKFGFRWGSDSQHLHTRFLVKRRAIAQPNSQMFSQNALRPNASLRPNANRQPQPVSPICRQFNSLSGCNWPNCRFQHVCLVANCNQRHPQHEHMTTTSAQHG